MTSVPSGENEREQSQCSQRKVSETLEGGFVDVGAPLHEVLADSRGVREKCGSVITVIPLSQEPVLISQAHQYFTEELSIKGVITGLPDGTPNRLARGCLHSKATLTIKNTYEGFLDIDGCSVAIISYASTLSTSNASHVDFLNNSQGVKYFYSQSDAGTYSVSDLVMVSGQSKIGVFLTNGEGKDGEIDANFSGNTYQTCASTVSIKPFYECAVVDDLGDL
ncbi:hypothetical protein FB45DRAFT_370156 [Roridomyces roridus]|uniref:Uncharacterized protein n=1 Tax=Roridomyces roridus TaxID=1738132 RepID=A0AAD7FBL6_9AGAR|nr:hypothetical protein FB45DRAFT_370156 [Roridomyces roridus]